MEILDRAELARRYPQLESTGIERALFEPACGAIAARRAVQLLFNDLVRRGVAARHVRVARSRATTRRMTSVQTQDGDSIAADAFVFACGAWLPDLLPVLRGRIRPTRQVVVYFGSPTGDARFTPARLPAWIDFPAGIYGVPDLDGCGLKVGIDEHGPPIDPDDANRAADDESIFRARAWLARRMPAMRKAPVIEARVCQYENTSSGDFVIDTHPDYDNVWIVGGGSGHGFKHGPAVGERVSRMVLDGAPTHPRFALETKDVTARRAVY